MPLFFYRFVVYLRNFETGINDILLTWHTTFLIIVCIFMDFLFQAIQKQGVSLLWNMKNQFKDSCFKNRYIIVVHIKPGDELLLFKREILVRKPLFVYPVQFSVSGDQRCNYVFHGRLFLSATIFFKKGSQFFLHFFYTWQSRF